MLFILFHLSELFISFIHAFFNRSLILILAECRANLRILITSYVSILFIFRSVFMCGEIKKMDQKIYDLGFLICLINVSIIKYSFTVVFRGLSYEFFLLVNKL